jgi:hypothetical protein
VTLDHRSERPETNGPKDRNMPRTHYDNQEVFAALRDLSMEEIRRIQSFARFRLGGQTRPGHVEVEDLFADATIRTMARKRRWKRGVSSFNYFVAAIRSIGHQGFKQAVRYEPLSDVFPAAQGGDVSAGEALVIVARLKEQLCGDAMALEVLESMMDEMRPRRAQQSMGISAKVYWAARKRIRRRAEQLPAATAFWRRNAPQSTGAVAV